MARTEHETYLEALIDINERMLQLLSALATKEDIQVHDREARERVKDLLEKINSLQNAHNLVSADAANNFKQLMEGVSKLKESDNKLKWIMSVVALVMALIGMVGTFIKVEPVNQPSPVRVRTK